MYNDKLLAYEKRDRQTLPALLSHFTAVGLQACGKRICDRQTLAALLSHFTAVGLQAYGKRTYDRQTRI